MEVERKRTWRSETLDRLLPRCDLGESAVWPLELRPGPAPHCYLIHLLLF